MIGVCLIWESVSRIAVPSATSPAVFENSGCSTLLAAFRIVGTFKNSDVQWFLIMILIYILLMANVEWFISFMCFFVFFIASVI